MPKGNLKNRVVGSKRFVKNSLPLAIGTMFAGAVSLPVFAENSLAIEEIVVMAQKREQGLQDVPVSVSVMTGEKMEEAGISDLDDFAAHIPNLQVNTSAFSTIYIRGLGSDFNYGFEQSVGTYVDGMYLGRQRQTRGVMMDLEAFEVLRGPQGTLYGKNTIAGALNIRSRKPTEEIEGSFTVKTGEYGQQELQAVVSGPITDTFKARVAVLNSDSEGYIDNRLGEDGGGTDRQNFRLTGVWDATESLEVIAKFETGQHDTMGSTYQLTNFGSKEDAFIAQDPFAEVSSSDLNSSVGGFGVDKYFQNTESDLAQLTMNYATENGYELTALSGYSSYEAKDSIDFDYSALEAVYSYDVADYESQSQEVRLISPTDEDYYYIIGAYYESTEYSRAGGYTLLDFSDRVSFFSQQIRTPASFDQDTSAWSIFYEGTNVLSDSLNMTYGVRYSEERKKAFKEAFYTDLDGKPICSEDSTFGKCVANPGFDNAALAMNSFAFVEHVHSRSRTQENITPSIKFQYFGDSDDMYYMTLATGYKSGGFNATEQTGDPEKFEFDEETSLAYELGAKYELLDGQLQVNAALYVTKFKDLQVSSFDGTTFQVTNAAQATTQGLELDAVFRATESITMGGAFAFSDATYDDFDNAACTQAQKDAWQEEFGITELRNCNQDLTGKDLMYAPDTSASFWLEHNLTIGSDYELSSSFDVNYSADYFLSQDLDENDSQDSFAKLNARMVFRNLVDQWEVAFVGKNLTDELTLVRSTDIPLVEAGTHVAGTAPPRTVAAQFKMNF